MIAADFIGVAKSRVVKGKGQIQIAYDSFCRKSGLFLPKSIRWFEILNSLKEDQHLEMSNLVQAFRLVKVRDLGIDYQLTN